MVFLWSCWWFQNIWKTLDKSENAQIISTKWTWVKLVNDTLFKIINDKILKWEDIVWDNVWRKLERHCLIIQIFKNM